MTDPINNLEDVIDSCDVIARIEDLETRAESEDADDALDEDEAAELASLKKLAEEGEQYAPDWTYGEALIRDSYFRDYAQELAEDIGAVNSDARWPNNCIDWEQAARELQMDYTAIEFEGVTYWIQ